MFEVIMLLLAFALGYFARWLQDAVNRSVWFEEVDDE